MACDVGVRSRPWKLNAKLFDVNVATPPVSVELGSSVMPIIPGSPEVSVNTNPLNDPDEKPVALAFVKITWVGVIS